MKECFSSKKTAEIGLDRFKYLFKGFKVGIPIAIGYIPIAIAFGLLASSSGLPYYIPILMSLLVFAGASQFVGINLLSVATGSLEIILTTLILNFRHFLMTASISQKLGKNTSRKLAALLAFGITDETFSVASLEKTEDIEPMYLLGLNIIAYAAWNIGTAIGVFAATAIPQALQNSMGIALYVMFIGLLVPSLSESNKILICSLLSALIHGILQWTPFLYPISSGWKIVIATVIAASLIALLDKEESVK